MKKAEGFTVISYIASNFILLLPVASINVLNSYDIAQHYVAELIMSLYARTPCSYVASINVLNSRLWHLAAARLEAMKSYN